MDWLDLLEVQGTLSISSNITVQFYINSSALNFLYSPALTSIHPRTHQILVLINFFSFKSSSTLFSSVQEYAGDIPVAGSIPVTQLQIHPVYNLLCDAGAGILETLFPRHLCQLLFCSSCQ